MLLRVGPGYAKTVKITGRGKVILPSVMTVTAIDGCGIQANGSGLSLSSCNISFDKEITLQQIQSGSSDVYYLLYLV